MNPILTRSLYRPLRKVVAKIDSDPALRAVITVPYTFRSGGFHDVDVTESSESFDWTSGDDVNEGLKEMEDTSAGQFGSSEDLPVRGEGATDTVLPMEQTNSISSSAYASHAEAWQYILHMNGGRHYFQPTNPSAKVRLLPSLRELFEGNVVLCEGIKGKEHSTALTTALVTSAEVVPPAAAHQPPHIVIDTTTAASPLLRPKIAVNYSAMFFALRYLNHVLDAAKPVLSKPLYSPPKYPLTLRDFPLTVMDPRDKDSEATHAQFLIAHPMETCLRHGVILLSIHDGISMGWLVNTPLLTNDGQTMSVGKVLGNTHPLFAEYLSENIVMAGGPVESPRNLTKKDTAIFVLHRVPDVEGSSLVCPGVWGCSNLENLQAAFREGRARAMDVTVLMGYCGWSSGQLHDEMTRGVWWCATSNQPSVSQSIIFHHRTARTHAIRKRKTVKENPARTWCEVLGSISPELLTMTRLVTALPPPTEAEQP